MRETAEEFKAFFSALWGEKAYPWQVRLAERVVHQGWPVAIALPTGSGKTAAIDVAVFAIARSPCHPRRVVYVVNRRVVVDQTEERAQRIAQKLQEALGNPESPLHLVAKGLAELGGGIPLRVIKLRGGLPLPQHPIPDPAAPTVVISTLDQVGSRLLFRGYSLSPKAWPVEAGLLGIDSLYLLDEAHLERPAFHLLQTLENMLGGVSRELGRPGLKVVALTATPETLELDRAAVFSQSEEDEAEERLRKRWGVSKPLRLRKVASSETLSQVLANKAKELGQKVGGPVVVFCNRVATAREVHQHLLGQGDQGEREVLLLMGRSRPFDRDQLLGRRNLQDDLDRGKVAYVVSTQALEVGSDLDFAAVVTELCPLNALFQRLGRGGRRGERPEAPVVVVWEGNHPSHPYSPEALKATLDSLEKIDRRRDPDLGILSLLNPTVRKILSDNEKALDKGADPLPLPPELLQLYSLTDPFIPDLQVEPLLHGTASVSPEVGLAFRKDIRPEEVENWNQEGLRDLLLPPSLYEVLPLPIWAARAFLEMEEKGKMVSDLEVEATMEEDAGHSGKQRKALRFTGEGVEVVLPKEIRPGDVLLVPAEYGGLDEFGYNPNSQQPVRDVGEARPEGAEPPRLIRLHPGVLRDALDLKKAPEGYSELLDRVLEALREACQHLQHLQQEDEGLEQAHRSIRRLEEALHRLEGVPGSPEGGPGPGNVERRLREALGRLLDNIHRLAHPQWKRAYEKARSEVDRLEIRVHPLYPGVVLRLRGETLSIAGSSPVSLDDHHKRVKEILEGYLDRLRIKGKLAFLMQAAEIHDLGKLDPRMQRWLRRTAPPGPLPEGPLAKSGTRLGPREVDRIREWVGYPSGQRHELVAAATLQGKGGMDPEVLHLVATHHGHGRPIPKGAPEGESEVTVPDYPSFPAPLRSLRTAHRLNRLDSGHVQRFTELSRKYTPWGLAYLEALLRLADQSASEGA